MLLYFIAYIDRVNIGFAAMTMKTELGFSAAMLGIGAGIFFRGYFMFEVPSNLILHKVGARLWIARMMVTWGIISGASPSSRGATSFYGIRFLLGPAEASFYPGIILYLSYWFPARHRAGVTGFLHGRRADLHGARLAALRRIARNERRDGSARLAMDVHSRSHSSAHSGRRRVLLHDR